MPLLLHVHASRMQIVNSDMESRFNARRDFEAEVGDHLMCFRGLLPPCGQVAVDEHRVGRIETERLKRAQIYLAAAADANFLAGIDKADETENFQAALRRDLMQAFKGSSGNRVEKVHRDRVDIQLL